MRRRYWVFIAVSCVFFLLAGCQQQAKVAEKPDATEAVTKEGGPKIEFESLVHDFGKVGPRKKLNGEFKFTNTGDAPLKITKVERCCGVVATLDKTEYEPGESGVLKVQYTSSRTATKIMKRLYVNSNDKSMPRATLTIKAETVVKVDYEPKHLKLLLKVENAGCPPITIKSVDKTPFSITQFQTTNDALTADIDSSVEATKFVITPKADIEKLQKNRNGRINIDLAFSDPNVPTEIITIYFNALKRFSTSPAMLLFLYNKPDEPIKKTLRITNNYGEEFEVESGSSKEGHIKVLSQKKIGKRFQFELEITPPPGDDVKRFTDTFTINLKDDEKLEVACQGIYRAQTTKKAGK